MTQQAPSTSDSVRRLGASLLAIGRIRLELLSIEVQEEKDRLAKVLFWSVLGALLIGFSLIFLALFATAALWETHRLVVLGTCTGLFFATGAYGAWRVRRLINSPSGLFEHSLAELRDDEAALRRRSGAA